MDTSMYLNDNAYGAETEGTFELISKVAYLIGVPKRIFDNEFEPPKLEIYGKMDLDKNARIIRNLCIIRTSIERNFKHINDLMRTQYRTILSMPDYVPSECLRQLNEDGVNFIKKSSTRLSQHIVEINRVICDRINNCKDLFPIWISWDYIRELFIMPNGLTEAGTKTASDLYYSNLNCYPYKVYINWIPRNEGNILYNDKKFATLLYEWHNDVFTDLSMVSDAKSFVKGNIYSFLDDSQKTFLVVDCENSDPYKLCGMLNNLNADELTKITRILLFDDVNASSAWRMLDEYTSIPVEHMLIERIKEDKSLVDIRLATRVCQEHYQNHVDSFLIVSSDSDFWGLISSLPEAKFLVAVERENCGPDMRRALEESGIYYCYLDNFYTGNSEQIKFGTLFKEMRRYLDRTVKLNLNDMLAESLHKARIEMTTTERRQFYNKYLRQMSLAVSENGGVTFEFHGK